MRGQQGGMFVDHHRQAGRIQIVKVIGDASAVMIDELQTTDNGIPDQQR